MTSTWTDTPGASNLQRVMTLVLLYVALLIVLGPAVQFSQWHIGPDNNQAAAEAMAWLDGRLDLPSRGGDVALYKDHFYNVFPPLWTLICFAVYAMNSLVFGEPLVFWTVLFNIVLAGPVPLAFYWAFRRSGAGTLWAPVLAFGAIAGTALWPVAAMLAGTRTAWIYSIQLIMAQTGLAILLADVLGRRRFWLGGLGILIAAWSRQTCVAYALPLLWLAWRSPHRKNALIRAGIPLVITLAIPMTLNYAKFDSPLETGYRYIFDDPNRVDADPVRGPDGSVDIFAWRYLPSHAYHMWLSLPTEIDLTPCGLAIQGHGKGTAVWFGTPLILLVLVAFRQWWADPRRRALMLGTIPVIFGTLLYHGPTIGQAGYYRYALDFLPIWLVVIAPWTDGPKRRWFTLACLAWSVLYFYMIVGR
ncbi:MAG: hypothetical protein ABII12_06550 [Planctomycetota bacterium]